MSFIEDMSERGLGWTLWAGLAVAAVSAAPRIIKATRPLAKGAIKVWLAAESQAKESFAEVGERMQDLYAEARHEYETDQEKVEAEKPEHPAMAKAEAVAGMETPHEAEETHARRSHPRKEQAEGEQAG